MATARAECPFEEVARTEKRCKRRASSVLLLEFGIWALQRFSEKRFNYLMCPNELRARGGGCDDYKSSVELLFLWLCSLQAPQRLSQWSLRVVFTDMWRFVHADK